MKDFGQCAHHRMWLNTNTSSTDSWHTSMIHFTPKGQLKVESYPLDHVFTNEDLQAVTPLDVCHWFCLIAYIKEAPDRNDRPLYSTRNTLLYHKKALSYFMPNTLHSWDEIHCNGNPTKAQDVNKVLQVIKKWEICGEGKKSNADCPLELEVCLHDACSFSSKKC